MMDYCNNRYSSMWLDCPMRNGGQTVMRTDDAYVMFSYRVNRTSPNPTTWGITFTPL